MSIKHKVEIKQFAEKHYIKKFKKKYKTHWDVTLDAILQMLQKPDELFKTERLNEVSRPDDRYCVCKLKFTIAGTGASAKSSGNRAIIAIDKTNFLVTVLLVFHKNDLKGQSSETTQWKKIIKENFSNYKNLL